MALIAENKSNNVWFNENKLNPYKRLGDANDTIKKLQHESMTKFNLTGLPDRKSEDYKYTHIRSYLTEDYTTNTTITGLENDTIIPSLHDDFVSVVMLNGKFLPEHSHLKNLPDGITLKSLFKALEEGDELAIKQFNAGLKQTSNPLAMLNTALAGDGIFISIPENFSCPVPIHIANICSGENKTLYNPRNLIYLNKKSELMLLETHNSIKNKAFTNSVSEIFIGDEANLDSYTLQEEPGECSRNDIQQYIVGAGAYLNNLIITVDGRMVRNDTNVIMEGSNSEVHLNGLFLVKENNHTDNHTLIEHRVPNCFSNELYKGIIEDGATGVFNGKILVYKDAQKTNAYQSNKNILLGDKATIDTKPQLEIYADDVRCTHGTSTGRLDEEALFYLRSRGLTEQLAKKLILQAFAKETCNTIKNETFKIFIEKKIEENI